MSLIASASPVFLDPYSLCLTDTVSKSILRLFQIKLQLFSLTSVLRAGVEFIYIYCAQRGVPPLAARPSLEKFFIDGHNVPVRNIAYLRTMVFYVYMIDYQPGLIPR
jgi:hypothetical protein